MTEHSPRRKGKHRSEPTTPDRDYFVTYRVDAVVEAKEASRLDSSFDRTMTQPQLAQLLARNDAVLPIGERSEPSLGRTRVTFSTHTVV
jgi:hypothetical protein